MAETRTEDGLRPATEDDIPRLVEILDEAFADDPVVNWVCSDAGYREFVFRAVLPYYLQKGIAQISTDRNGVALWLPPNVELPGKELIVYLWHHWRQFGFSATMRMISVFQAMDRAHYKGPHYYLFTIGVTRAGRGTGIGSRLIRSGLEKADQEGVPAYLENSNEQNREVYKHFGFEETGELTINKGPTLWTMVRQPSPGEP